MRNKIIFPASLIATAAVAFGLGTLNLSHTPDSSAATTRQNVSAPDSTPSETPATTAPNPTSAADTSNTTRSTSQRPNSTTSAGTSRQQTSTPKDAKATATPKAGSKGPLTDAEGDGKVLDDIGTFLPVEVPSIPDEYLPFPGSGEALPGYEDTSGEAATDDGTDHSNDAATDEVIQDQEAWDELMAAKAAQEG